MELFIFTFAALFSIMNPLGTVPVFVGLTQESTVKERGAISFWTSFNVLIILLFSFFVGKYFLTFFGISLNSLKIAGGLIITSSGFALLITYNQLYIEPIQIIIISGAMTFTSLIIFFILKGSHFIVKILGGSGVNSLSRIIGFVVIAIGIEYIISAVLNIINDTDYL